MPRRPRLQYPRAVYHVVSRGNRKCSIYCDDDDRHLFFATLTETVLRYRIRVNAGCQMGTHYHLVIETPDANLSAAMQFLNSKYSQTFNRRHGYVGHLFQGPFKSQVVQRERYLRRACRYVVLNPVKGRLVSAAVDWPWSSYRATAGLEEPPAWLHTDWIVSAFDAATPVEAQERYREFVNNPIARRMRMNGDALIVGSKDFKNSVVDSMKHALRDRELPKGHRALARPDLATVFGESVGEVGKRDQVIYLAHVIHAYSLSEIARFLRLDRSTISRAFQRAQCRFRNSDLRPSNTPGFS